MPRNADLPRAGAASVTDLAEVRRNRAVARALAARSGRVTFAEVQAELARLEAYVAELRREIQALRGSGSRRKRG